MSFDAHPVVAWLMGDGRRILDPSAFLDALCKRLRKRGVGVTRMTTGIPILHPQISSYSGLWEYGNGPSARLYHLTTGTSAAFQNSPIRIVYEGGGPVRCDLRQPEREGEFSVLADLRQQGLTDYIVLPAPFSDGTIKAVSVATDRPDGFSDDDIALFEAMMPPLAMNLEVQTLRRTARTLLDTYVGRQAGGRVLDGAITRGTGETIRAVIWLCDLRGFTSMSEALPRDALIELLNQYFGAMAGAVEANGGEVLKFIGDAMLAIFSFHDAADAQAACRAALASAEQAQASLAEINQVRSQTQNPPINYGIALHVGDVMYGNIGGETRLDFTVIGPAVNLAARIEGLCGELGRSLLLSHEFAGASGVPTEPVGEFALKGVGAPQAVYAPSAAKPRPRKANSPTT